MYYGYNWFGTEIYPHPQKNQWRNEEPVNSWQTFFSLLIFISFIALFIDWSWFSKRIEERQKNIILPGTLAYEETIAEISQVMDQVKKKVEVKNLDLKEATSFNYQIVEFCSKIEVDWTDKTSFIMDKARECFVDNWQPPEETPESYKKLFAENDLARKEHAKVILNFKVMQAFAETPQPDCMRVDIDWPAVGLWFLKWYYLLVFPSVFCLLLNVWFVKKSFKAVIEKVYFDYREIFYAGCFGPFGLIFVSETANSLRCYRKILREFLKTKESGYRPTALEEKAIWAKVMAPVLSFEDAITKAEKELVYRPALAGFAVWILGSFSLVSAKSQISKPVVFISSQIDSENEVLKSNEGISFKNVFSSFKLPKIKKINLCFIGIEPVIFQAPDFIISEASVKKVLNREFLIVVQPRAPPKEARDIFISSPAACAA
ncbi:MAG: hypothetical protein WC435_01320 [Candidatus Paceibacterota bacterium]